MLLRWFFFQTKAGDLLLAWLEKAAGLAVVEIGEIEPSEVRVIGAQERAPAFEG